MTEEQNSMNRRNFLKSVGVAGVSGSFALTNTYADQDATKKKKNIVLPKRTLGRTGVKVPALSLGMMFNTLEKQFVLRRTLQLGVTWWDTAHMYINGASELGIGKFLGKNPDLRKEIFLETKASLTKTIADVENRLQSSLKRLKTDYVDLYYLHDTAGTGRLTNELRDWAADAKKRGLIRFFGFSMHKKVTQSLEFAAKLDWIDSIMFPYNFRLMQDKELNAAIDACHRAGIGLVAIKTQGMGSRKKIETDADKKIVEHFLKRGFTEGQAKLRAVFDDPRFANVCVGRDNVEHLEQNVAAVLDKTKLTKQDFDALGEYARQTCSGYCAGCAHICDDALGELPWVSDVMRYLMYYNSYGDKESAREHFARIPEQVRGRLLTADYSRAEARCPQRLPIRKLIIEAVNKLA